MLLVAHTNFKGSFQIWSKEQNVCLRLEYFDHVFYFYIVMGANIKFRWNLTVLLI